MISLSAMEEAGYRLLRQVVETEISRGATRLLEAGSGDCALLQEWVNHFEVDATGIDPYSYPVQTEHLHCHPIPAEEVNRLEGRFHLVFSVMSLHHFSEIRRFFRNLLQVIGWRGKLVLVDWKHGTNTGIPERYFSAAEVRDALRECGWEVRETREEEFHFRIQAEPMFQKIAVATADRKTIFKGMLGQAPYFHIYEVNRQGAISFREKRENPFARTMQHLKTLEVYRVIEDCALFVSRRIGKKGIQRLRDRGIALHFAEGEIAHLWPELLKKQSYTDPPENH